MAIENRRMQQRYGSYDKFKTDKGKHLPNEFLSVTSGDPNSGTGKGLYFAFTPSEVEQLMTRENGKKLVDDASDEIRNNFLSDIRTAISQSQSATLNINVLTEQIKAAIEEANASSEEARNTIWNNKNLTNNSSDTEITVETVHAPAVLRMVKGKTEQKNIKGINLAKYSTSGYNKNIGDLEKGKIYTMFWKQDYEGTDYGFNLRYGSSDESLQIATTKKYIGKLTKALFTAPENGILYFNGYRKANQREIMLVEGDLYDTAENIPFEPYTGNKPAPNTEYPQDIKGIGKELNIESNGKNWFDVRKALIKGNAAVKILDERTIIIETKEGYAGLEYYVPKEVVTFMIGKKIKIVGKITKLSGNENAVIQVKLGFSDGKDIWLKNGADEYLVPENCTQMVVCIYNKNSSGNASNNLIYKYEDILFTTSENDVGFAPYEHTSLSVPLPSPMHEGDILCMVKAGQTYIDSVGVTQTADKDLWGVYRTNLQYECTGNENILSGSSGLYFTLANISKERASTGSIFCTHFRPNVWEKLEDGEFCQGNLAASLVGFKSSIYNTPDLLRDFFKEQKKVGTPVLCILLLEKPYFEPFSDQAPFTQFYSAENETTFYTTDSLQPVLTIDSAKTPEGAIVLNSYIQSIKNAQTIRKAQLQIEDIQSYIGYTDADIYGVEVDFKNKKFTRLAGAVGKTPGDAFDGIKAFGGRRRCNVTDDGKVIAYYGDAGYTETGKLTQQIVIEDGENAGTYPVGTLVQVMVEQPKFYYKVVPLELENTTKGSLMRKARYYVSPTAKAGFKLHPAFISNGRRIEKIYFSAFEGSLWDTSANTYILDDAQVADFTNDMLCSIANAKPISGLTQNLTRANVRKLAQKRGTGWQQSYAATVGASQMLMLIEYASFDMQSAIGVGVTNKNDDGSTSMTEKTGATTTLGNKTGSIVNTNGWNVVSYRGEENIWGNIWTWIDGINVQNPSTWDTSTGKGEYSDLYIADHDFADDKGASPYEKTNLHPCWGSGYISAFCYAPDFDWVFIPGEIAGNSSLPVSDVFWNYNPNWRVATLGGNWNNRSNAGAFDWKLNTYSYRYRSIGGRLVYVPQVD